MAIIPSLRLSCSMLSAASSRVKSVDDESYRFAHRSRDSSLVAERLPPNIKARSDSPLVLPATTATSEGPSVAFPSVRPVLGAITWADSGIDCTTASGAAMVASGCGPPIAATTTSACVDGDSTGGVMSATADAACVTGSSIHPIAGSGITSIAGYVTTSEGVR